MSFNHEFQLRAATCTDARVQTAYRRRRRPRCGSQTVDPSHSYFLKSNSEWAHARIEAIRLLYEFDPKSPSFQPKILNEMG